MRRSKGISARLRRNLYCSTALAVALAPPAIASVLPAKATLDIPSQPLALALQTFSIQTNSQVLFSGELVAGHQAPRIKGQYVPKDALAILIKGTGLHVEQSSDSVFLVKPNAPKHIQVAQAARRAPAASAAPAASSIETVVVTAQHKTENIQNVPIAITALSQAQLTERQVAGGPDLVKEVPNLTFSKTNFTGYNLEIRGIGTQAISVTTDPAVAVAFNGTPFIRNHFFEQEFFDVQDVEVLRGPQGTLYGRNATAGVVNLKSAPPTDQYEAMLSADIGNYSNRRLEGMVNIPIVGDKLDLRIAGEWTKRDGYSFNSITNQPIDGRDLWSGRVSLAFNPTSNLKTTLVWEHFQEDDDRLRSGKQLCETSQAPTSINGTPVPPPSFQVVGNVLGLDGKYLSQGCEATSLYSPNAFEVPNGFSIPYVIALELTGIGNFFVDPYASTTQSRNLRVIESALEPHYQAKNDTLELNAEYAVTPSLTFTSQTGYNHDFLSSSEDYNRFNTAPGIFSCSDANGGSAGVCADSPVYDPGLSRFYPDPSGLAFYNGQGGTVLGAQCTPNSSNANECIRTAVFCDPQVGCSDRLVSEDLSNEHAWQLSQEFRLASNFGGPFNFSLGGNYLHYETEENYYVFSNALTVFALASGGTRNNFLFNTGDNSGCLQMRGSSGYQNPRLGGSPLQDCVYVDPSPITNLNNYGHNYFLSQNPYTLNSYAGFGEAYYNITDEVKLTGGLRWTEDQKHFTDIPSQVVVQGYGYPVTGIVNQQWDELTGRAVLNWTPELDFTDQTLVYGSSSRGYKAGGANPPGAVFSTYSAGEIGEPIHPLTFKPEFINAYEIGTKNALLGGTLTLNGDIFYYDYKNYQISEIVDRTSINLNFNATVEGAELETTYEPVPGLRFNFAGGYEDTRIADGQSAIDLMDRTAGTPGWLVVKPFPTQASNCILPSYVVQAILESQSQNSGNAVAAAEACGNAFDLHLDPVTLEPYTPNPSGPGGVNYPPGCGPNSSAGNCSTPFPIPSGYPGFNPATAPNNGEGFAKNLGGNKLPNAPPFTVSFGAEYSVPVTADWVATLRGDYYWQDYSWARVFNDNPYDRLRGYTNVNLSLILNSANGWQVMAYVKNVFNVTAITGDFLNSDDSGLTTNVFLTDPRLFGVRVTKELDQADGFWGSDWSGYDLITDLFADEDGGKPPLWIELGGQADHIGGQGAVFSPGFLTANPTSSVLWKGTSPTEAQRPPLFDFGDEAKVTFQPEGSDWVVAAGIVYGRSGNFKHVDHQTNGMIVTKYKSGAPVQVETVEKFADTQVHRSESHAVIDFMAGKDVGLGTFGLDGSSILSGGIRIAQFASHSSIDMRARPDLHLKYFPSAAAQTRSVHPYFHTYHATERASRSFHGIGPSLSWNGSAALAGNVQDGEVALDLGANAAFLFGRQRANVKHQESGHYVSKRDFVASGDYALLYQRSGGHDTNRSIVAPNVGGFAGLSYRWNNAKISFGYRADFFFGAIDGGIDKRKSETLNMSGPFATIGIGLGG